MSKKRKPRIPMDWARFFRAIRNERTFSERVRTKQEWYRRERLRQQSQGTADEAPTIIPSPTDEVGASDGQPDPSGDA